MKPSNQTLVWRQKTPCHGDPPVFVDDQAAIWWGIAQGAYHDSAAAQTEFEQLRATYPTAYLWPAWIRAVGRKLRKF